MQLADLLDLGMLQKLAEANFAASGMPIGIIDAADGSVLVGVGWQDICVMYHRAHPETARRCRESDDHIKLHAQDGAPCEYTCHNGLRDIGLPIRVEGQHLATLFLGQFLYEDERPDRAFFVQQARQFGFDEGAYLAALDRVPVFSRAAVANILAYDAALAAFVSDLAEAAVRRRRADADRERLEQELRDASRAKDEFLAMLSHELRNPLAAIQNALYLLEHAEPAGQQALLAKQVAGRQLRHLKRMVDDLLDVTRIAKGKVELRRTRLDLADLARRAGEDHRAQAEQRGLALEVRTPDAPVIVMGDETRLAQAIGNLLQNAAKFTPAGGRVTLEVRTAPGEATVLVRDTGAGIPPELLERVFDPFVQAGQSLARSEGGLGLGLSLVKAMVELHGGSVRVSSPGAGRGTEVAFRLPLADEPSS
ncbi:PocR ligand-binding domain-containing protein [Anaeromyxobacter paludicola]|uniref:histidine kinase n=1 Tax=Anaeromyxobacter paludicola TaxID=2918171 RepID=A0ABN6N9X0_9BACT|nr:PocR ligand-binding domain-containing protein [Anaeromyxobacter paludicola]BDG10031.1 hypothetical protein AMPC_31440 [Anaeromyxobacter paludicola]